MRQLTKQQVFDGFAKHMAKQKRRSIYPGGVLCGYRGPGRTRCGIGKFITNAQYNKDMEGQSVRDILGPFKLAQFANCDTWMLGELQSIHDHECVEDYTMDRFHRRMKGLAKTLKLDTTVYLAQKYPKKWLAPLKPKNWR